jgi:site-specific DNA recombinase
MSATRCAIYARFSSDRQNERSAEDQVSDCRRHADREGWQVVEVYTDLAISGASNRRPGMMALLADAAAGAFDVVLAEDQDRITRDLEDSAAIYKRLTFADVELWTLSGGRVDELQIGFKGTMDALELRKIGEKVRRGQRGNLARGRVPGGLTYGYDVVRGFDDRGRVDAGRRRINPDQAAIVVRIFEEVAAGRSPRRSRTISTPKGSGRLGAANGAPRRSSATARARSASCTTRSTSAASSTAASPAGAIRRPATASGARPRPSPRNLRHARAEDRQRRSVAIARTRRSRERASSPWSGAAAAAAALRAGRMRPVRRQLHRLRQRPHVLLEGPRGRDLRQQGDDPGRRARAAGPGGPAGAAAVARGRVADGARVPPRARADAAGIGKGAARARAAAARGAGGRRPAGRRDRGWWGEFAELRDALARKAAERELAERELAELEAPSTIALHPHIADAYRARIERLVAGGAAEMSDAVKADIRGLIEAVYVRPADAGGSEVEIVGSLEAAIALASGAPPPKRGTLSAMLVAGDRFQRNRQRRSIMA